MLVATGKPSTIKLLFDAVEPESPSLNLTNADKRVPGVDGPNETTSCEGDAMVHDVAFASPIVAVHRPPWTGVMKLAPTIVAVNDCKAAT
jgi:hypothetical protein